MEAHDSEVRVAILKRFITHGHAPVVPEIADELALSPLDVELSLHRLADARVLVLAPGTPYVWMAHPFSSLPTPFRVEGTGGRWWANCIWDSFGVIAMTGRSGRISTWCPDCSAPLEINVRDGQMEAGDGVVHYSVPAAQWWDDIGFN